MRLSATSSVCFARRLEIWVEPESGMSNPPSPQRGTTHTWRKAMTTVFPVYLGRRYRSGPIPVSASGCLVCNVKSTLNRRSTLSEVPYGAPRSKEPGCIVNRAVAWFPRILGGNSKRYQKLSQTANFAEADRRYLDSGTRNCQDRSILACPGKLTSGRLRPNRAFVDHTGSKTWPYG